MMTRFHWTAMQHCITTVLFISLAVELVTKTTSKPHRPLHDWIQILINGQESSVTTISKNTKKLFLYFLWLLFTRRKAGALKRGRSDHGVIFDGEKFLIIGGRGENWWETADRRNIKNEVCTLEGTTMTCVEQSTTLYYYLDSPELFLVAVDFDKNVEKCWNFSPSAQVTIGQTVPFLKIPVKVKATVLNKISVINWNKKVDQVNHVFKSYLARSSLDSKQGCW